MIKRVATCSQFLERGEDHPLFDSRSFIIYVIYNLRGCNQSCDIRLYERLKNTSLKTATHHMRRNEEGLQKHVSSYTTFYTQRR